MERWHFEHVIVCRNPNPMLQHIASWRLCRASVQHMMATPRKVHGHDIAEKSQRGTHLRLWELACPALELSVPELVCPERERELALPLPELVCLKR